MHVILGTYTVSEFTLQPLWQAPQNLRVHLQAFWGLPIVSRLLWGPPQKYKASLLAFIYRTLKVTSQNYKLQIPLLQILWGASSVLKHLLTCSFWGITQNLFASYLGRLPIPNSVFMV